MGGSGRRRRGGSRPPEDGPALEVEGAGALGADQSARLWRAGALSGRTARSTRAARQGSGGRSPASGWPPIVGGEPGAQHRGGGRFLGEGAGGEDRRLSGPRTRAGGWAGCRRRCRAAAARRATGAPGRRRVGSPGSLRASAGTEIGARSGRIPSSLRRRESRRCLRGSERGDRLGQVLHVYDAPRSASILLDLFRGQVLMPACAPASPASDSPSSPPAAADRASAMRPARPATVGSSKSSASDMSVPKRSRPGTWVPRSESPPRSKKRRGGRPARSQELLPHVAWGRCPGRRSPARRSAASGGYADSPAAPATPADPARWAAALAAAPARASAPSTACAVRRRCAPRDRRRAIDRAGGRGQAPGGIAAGASPSAIQPRLVHAGPPPRSPSASRATPAIESGLQTVAGARRQRLARQQAQSAGSRSPSAERSAASRSRRMVNRRSHSPEESERVERLAGERRIGERVEAAHLGCPAPRLPRRAASTSRQDPCPALKCRRPAWIAPSMRAEPFAGAPDRRRDGGAVFEVHRQRQQLAAGRPLQGEQAPGQPRQPSRPGRRRRSGPLPRSGAGRRSPNRADEEDEAGAGGRGKGAASASARPVSSSARGDEVGDHRRSQPSAMPLGRRAPRAGSGAPTATGRARPPPARPSQGRRFGDASRAEQPAGERLLLRERRRSKARRRSAEAPLIRHRLLRQHAERAREASPLAAASQRPPAAHLEASSVERPPRDGAAARRRSRAPGLARAQGVRVQVNPLRYSARYSGGRQLRSRRRSAAAAPRRPPSAPAGGRRGTGRGPPAAESPPGARRKIVGAPRREGEGAVRMLGEPASPRRRRGPQTPSPARRRDAPASKSAETRASLSRRLGSRKSQRPARDRAVAPSAVDRARLARPATYPHSAQRPPRPAGARGRRRAPRALRRPGRWRRADRRSSALALERVGRQRHAPAALAAHEPLPIGPRAVQPEAAQRAQEEGLVRHRLARLAQRRHHRLPCLAIGVLADAAEWPSPGVCPGPIFEQQARLGLAPGAPATATLGSAPAGRDVFRPGSLDRSPGLGGKATCR